MYTNQARVEAYLKRELTSDEAELIDDAISSISLLIDNYTNRNWPPVDEEVDEYTDVSEARYFDGKGHKELFIDDFQSISEIELLDENGSSYLTLNLQTDWLLYPLNKDTKQSIRLRNYNFPSGSSNIKITGVWGAGSVPRGIVIACTALVGKFFQKSAVTGTFKKESIEGYSYELMTGADIDADTNKIMSSLDVFKKYEL